jgi:type VI secretion system protein ImpL
MGNKVIYAIITVVVVVLTVGMGFFRNSLSKWVGNNVWVLQALTMLVGLVSAGVITWLQHRKSSAGKDATPGKAAPADDLDLVLREAEARLKSADTEANAKLSTLPVVFVIGDTGSAKTTTVVKSGLDPELLAGQVYAENAMVPTASVNLWFARRTLFVEAAGKLLGDSGSWGRLLGKMQSGRIASMMRAGDEPPRAALVCVDAESLVMSGSEEVLAASARGVRQRLTEMSQQMGINLPVYVLFTKTDRLPFFEDYVRHLNNEEAVKTVGQTLPIVVERKGLYQEEETVRLNGAFDRLFQSLCNARPEFLSRENDTGPRGGIYEFPREFRKLRSPLVKYLVELCRPSQLTVGPFLRGFYFSGVRPVVVNEVATAPVAAQPAGDALGATGIFRQRAGSQSAPRIVGKKKVPQWLFVGHLFNDILLGDKTAMGASGASVKGKTLQRVLLFTAAVLCVLYSVALMVSFARNRSLENKVQQAAQGIANLPSVGANLAPLDALQRLDALREVLVVLRDGPGLSYRWGLYTGDALYPDVRRAYFAGFRKLLFDQTQTNVLSVVRGTPNANDTYETLKSYLITTSHHDKTTREFLPPVLVKYWSANREVDPARRQLAEKQFEFYNDELLIANPYSSDNDSESISKARRYLGQSNTFEPIYQAMLADAARNAQGVSFNKKFPGSAEVVINSYEVAAAFTKPGWVFMKASLKNPEKYFRGEQWVLGDQASVNLDRAKLGQDLAARYHADFIAQWRSYLKASSVVKYNGLPDAAKKLMVLSGNQSPLLALFWLASQNTDVDVPAVKDAFQPVHSVVPTTSVDRYIAPPNQPYMNALVALQTSVEAVAGQPQGNEAGAIQTLQNATSAKVTTRQLAQSFRLDNEAHVETTVQKLLEDPITNVEGLLRSLGPAELNDKGKGFCSEYRQLISKYPFNANSTVQATVADVNKVFKKPEGSLWMFYEASLKKYLAKQGSQYSPIPGGTVNLNPGFVSFFNQVAALSDTLYPDGSQDPRITYSLKPVPAEGIQTVGLQLDGQTLTYSGGAATAKQFVWQAQGTHEAKATVRFGGGPDLAWSSNDGLWAVFQFFHKAEQWRQTGNVASLEWVIRIGRDAVTLPGGKPLTVRFDLDMGGAPPVFQKGYLGRLACVSDVAR